jgi:hypothetical protein
MATNNRAFISFPVEDIALRDLLVGQGKSERTPFIFTDMSVKKPWDTMWKTQCLRKIKGCDGVIGLITKNTAKADGQIWELARGYEEGIPTLLIYGYPEDRPKNLPLSIRSHRIFTWSWSNIDAFLNKL